MKCAEVCEALPAYARDGDVSLAVRRHLSRCRDCKAELARYEALLGSLRLLEPSTIEPPPSLVRALTAIPGHPGRLEQARGHLARNRAAYVGGAVALAGAAAGAVVWRTRRGRLSPARA
ncbi:MAG: anti-sigma factor family protein [Actinomycetota bacterium]